MLLARLVPLLRFSLLTALGSGVWNAVFITAGYHLGVRWEQVAHVVQPVSYAVVVALAVLLVLLSVRTLRRRRAQRSAGPAL